MARGRRKEEDKKKNSGANLGFEASLWQAADALRGGNSTPTPISFQVGQRGSHIKFVKEAAEGIRTVIVPHHRKIAIGTLRSVLRQAGLTIDEFEAL